ncbi:uncharacterized protein LOC143284183 isoform X2 [Babylonia areolata]|uniref:uncharacterized protein LOC143284183 isoform X2 n=1 Tax=Babylonia areolata TaxID=304850 RepID=UPI003FD3D969
MDIHDWCRQSGLSPSTATVLRHEGFLTAEDLRYVTDDDVTVTFQKRRRVPLQQCVALREALRDFRQGHTRRRQPGGMTLAAWCQRHGLDAETTRMLEKQGFDSADDMNYVTAHDVRSTFQEEGTLLLQQCIALRKALGSDDEPAAGNDDDSDIRATGGKYGGRLMTINDPVKKSSRPCAAPRTRTTHAYYAATDSDRHPRLSATGDRSQLRDITSPDVLNDNVQPLGRGARSPHARNGCEGVELRMAVVGSEGSGKSWTVRTLLGHQGDTTVGQQCDTILQGETASGTLHRGLFCGRRVQILDTSGWLGTDRCQQHHPDTAAIISRHLQRLRPGPHAVLYTVDASCRYTKEQSLCLRQLEAILDPGRLPGRLLYDHLIVVFTHGDSVLQREKTGTRTGSRRMMEDLIRTAPPELRQVLDRCQGRYVLLDNTGSGRRRNNPSLPDQQQNSLDDLLEMVLDVASRDPAQPCLPVPEGPEAAEEMARRLSQIEEALVLESCAPFAHAGGQNQQQQEDSKPVGKRSKKSRAGTRERSRALQS